jgi:hypothetical protein
MAGRKYRDGEKKIIAPPDVRIVRDVIGATADLRPGARQWAALTLFSLSLATSGQAWLSRVSHRGHPGKHDAQAESHRF